MAARVVEDCAGALENAFLHDLLCACVSQEVAEKQSVCFRLNIAVEKIQVLVIQEEPVAAGKTLLCTSRRIFNRDFIAALKNAFKSFTFFRLVKTSADAYAIIAEASDATAVSVLSRLLAQKEFCCCAFCCAAGIPVSSIFEINVSYQDALRLLELKPFIDSTYPVLTRGNIRSVALKKAVYYPLVAEQTLIYAVIHKKIELWQSVLTDIIVENKNKSSLHTAQLAALFTATVYRILGSIQKEPDDIFAQNRALFLSITSCKKIEKLYECMKNILIAVTDCIYGGQNKKNLFLIKQIEDFIRTNYMKDIGLCDLATVVGLSPNYLSAVFKNALGKNFKDYLNYCRYEAACKLLRAAPSKRLKQVALECGCNSDILTRIFLKYGGILPSDFQKNILQENSPVWGGDKK